MRTGASGVRRDCPSVTTRSPSRMPLAMIASPLGRALDDDARAAAPCRPDRPRTRRCRADPSRSPASARRARCPRSKRWSDVVANCPAQRRPLQLSNVALSCTVLRRRVDRVVDERQLAHQSLADRRARPAPRRSPARCCPPAERSPDPRRAAAGAATVGRWAAARRAGAAICPAGASVTAASACLSAAVPAIARKPAAVLAGRISNRVHRRGCQRIDRRRSRSHCRPAPPPPAVPQPHRTAARAAAATTESRNGRRSGEPG